MINRRVGGALGRASRMLTGQGGEEDDDEEDDEEPLPPPPPAATAAAAAGEAAESAAPADGRTAPRELDRGDGGDDAPTTVQFETTLRIYEVQPKGLFSDALYATDGRRDGQGVYKLRADARRRVEMRIRQLTAGPLMVEKCVGMLLSPGQAIKPESATLLDIVDTTRRKVSDGVGSWT